MQKYLFMIYKKKQFPLALFEILVDEFLHYSELFWLFLILQHISQLTCLYFHFAHKNCFFFYPLFSLIHTHTHTDAYMFNVHYCYDPNLFRFRYNICVCVFFHQLFVSLLMYKWFFPYFCFHCDNKVLPFLSWWFDLLFALKEKILLLFLAFVCLNYVRYTFLRTYLILKGQGLTSTVYTIHASHFSATNNESAFL